MKRLVVGISGASGAQLAIELLQVMRQCADWETHVLISQGAKRTIALETDMTLEQVEALASKVYALDDIGAAIASGTYRTEGMVILPCSMKTLAGIAVGYSDNLLLRAADVIIKERRKLVLVAREAPLSAIHLQNMLTLAQNGAIILPPVLSFYNRPQSLEDVTKQIVGKILSLFAIETAGFKRWEEGVNSL